MSETASSATWTVGRLLEWTTGHFQKLKFSLPRLDAEVLLAEVLTCPRIQLYALWDTEVDSGQRDKFRDFVRRRAEGCPVAYLVGKREFHSLEFAVTPDVLIPRPETEFLVGEALAFAKQAPVERYVDVGVGSGAIAITLAKAWPNARGVALDLSDSALQVARGNAEKHGVADRVEFLRSDLLEAVGDREPFDLIVSNPPYVSAADYLTLATEVRNYEPRIALEAGVDGLDIYRRLIPQAANLLKPGGLFLLELGIHQEPAVRELLVATGKLTALPAVRDMQRIPRVIGAKRGPAAATLGS